MLTYQDFEKSKGQTAAFVQEVIRQHIASEDYRVATNADLYDRQKNVTINQYVRTILDLLGHSVEDYTVSNAKIASNFFHRLNVQRCTYSLGNGLSFTRKEEAINEDGVKTVIDLTKRALGDDFDAAIFQAGYFSLIHKVSFVFWNAGRTYVFPFTQFAPLYDEFTGALRAGVRFWQLDAEKPMIAVLYEEDGYTRLKGDEKGLNIEEEKRAYKEKIRTDSFGNEEVIGVENYSALPIVPFWGNRNHQSTLVGMQQSIDSFDLIRSGFANDLTDCAQIYWMIDNAGGMKEEDLKKFLDRSKFLHIAAADEDQKVTPYTQEIPYQARQAYLSDIRNGIYEDFGALDVHVISAAATNDHIEAAYQPMDENADDFEMQCIDCVRQILALQGIEDTPIFHRNRISNQKQQVEMVAIEAGLGVLDAETILSKLPNITPDEVQGILARQEKEAAARFEQPEEEEVIA